MDKDSEMDSVYYMPLKPRTFKTLSRLMTDNELALTIATFGGQHYLKPKEFTEAMRPKRVAKYVCLVLACVTAAVIAFTAIMAIRHASTPTMIMYTVGLSLWMIPAYTFADAEHKDNIRKGRALSRVFWLAEFRNFRFIGQVWPELYLPYFDMTEPSAANYDSAEA